MNKTQRNYNWTCRKVFSFSVCVSLSLSAQTWNNNRMTICCYFSLLSLSYILHLFFSSPKFSAVFFCNTIFYFYIRCVALITPVECVSLNRRENRKENNNNVAQDVWRKNLEKTKTIFLFAYLNILLVS